MGFAIRVWTSKAGCARTLDGSDAQVEVLGRLNPLLSFAIPCMAFQNMKIDSLFQTVRSRTRDLHAFSPATMDSRPKQDTSCTCGKTCSKQFLDPTS